MISREAARQKYANRFEANVLEAFLNMYAEAINEKDLDDALQYLVVPADLCQTGLVNKVFSEIELSTDCDIHVGFDYTNKFPGRLIAVYAESTSPELCTVLGPTKTFAVKIPFGVATKVRLTLLTRASSGCHAVVELLIKDAFTSRLLERINFPVVVK
jgi:hypothetical protein